jgi:hypothetical protein
VPRQVERATVGVLAEICGPSLPTREWLVRPGKTECRDRWPLVQDIYHWLDALGWAEDFKYQTRRQSKGLTFETGTGRVNNMTTEVNLIAVLLGRRPLSTLEGPLTREGAQGGGVAGLSQLALRDMFPPLTLV